MKFKATFLVAAFLFGVVGCSKSATAPSATVTGSWIGTVGTQALALQLNETSGNVTGSGTLNSGGAALAQTVQGTFSGTTFSATISAGLHPPYNIVTTLSGARLTGTANGSGFVGDPVVLTKQ